MANNEDFHSNVETGVQNEKKASVIETMMKNTRGAIAMLVFAVAPTMFASAQSTNPDKKPDNTKPKTEQVVTPIVNPADSNKVKVVLPPRKKINLDNVQSTVADKAKKDADKAKKDADKARQDLLLARKILGKNN